MKINKVMVCAVSFVVASVCLAAAKPKTSTPAGLTDNFDEVKVNRRSTDVVQLDMRIASGGKGTAKSYVITTQFGHESSYKNIKTYNYQNESNELKTQEVGICITVTPSLDDDGMISLNMTVHAVDEPTEKNKMKQPTFRVRRMNQRLRLPPGKSTVAQNDDLRVTVTPKIISFRNMDSSVAKVACNSNDVVQLDVRIASDWKKTGKSCRITTPFGRESAYKDTKEYRFQGERDVSVTRNVGVWLAATPSLNDYGVINLNLNMLVVEPTRKTTAGQLPFRYLSADLALLLSPSTPMTFLDGDLRVTVTPKIIPSKNMPPSAAN